MCRLLKIGSLVMMVLLAASPVFAQSTRVALVIGNSDYKHTPRLENPRNDAADMAAVLAKLGFTVLEGRDLDKAAMDRKVRDFAQALSGAKVGVFFYAGHGLQVGGQNYLVPVDAELKRASAIDFEMVRVDLMHRTMERETSTNILIIDACRDNPLARNLARALGTRSSQMGHGLAPVESGEGTLIAFSTQPGNVALDGAGRNSPYAAALLKHIATPGDDLPTILINVRNDVMQATERRQVPWEHSALTAKFYFIPPRTSAQQVELEFWGSVKDSSSPAVLGTYLERYPNGEFAPIARALIEHHEQQLKAELATREEERRRQEEERKAAEAKLLEDERRAREAALAQERKRAEEAKSISDIKRLEEQAKREWAARTEELRKALEEARQARDAANAAEEKRLAAVKAAEVARAAAVKAMEAGKGKQGLVQPSTTAPDKDSLRPSAHAYSAKIWPAGSIPTGSSVTADTPYGQLTCTGGRLRSDPRICRWARNIASSQFDGVWKIFWKDGSSCSSSNEGSYEVRINGGTVSGGGKSGEISSTGSAQWTHFNRGTSSSVATSVTFTGNSGSGRWTNANGCAGTLTAQRN